MAKQIVQFLKTHHRYVKGDIAGFDAETLAHWPKGVCVPYDPLVLSQAAVQSAADASAATQALAQARVGLDQMSADLDQRAADLDRRFAELEMREAELLSQVQATAAVEDLKADEPAEGDEPQAAKAAGAPPKQGAKG